MTSFFKLIQIIKQYDLGSVIKSIVFPFVFVIPTPTNHPLITINDKLQSLTVKKLRQMKSFPKSYKKQDMINALLITY